MADCDCYIHDHSVQQLAGRWWFSVYTTGGAFELSAIGIVQLEIEFIVMSLAGFMYNLQTENCCEEHAMLHCYHAMVGGQTTLQAIYCNV